MITFSRTARQVIASIVPAAFPMALAVAPTALGAQSREPFPGLDAYVNKALESMKVPGLGLAIVRNDSVIYVKGYGVRDVNTKAPVEERTIFAIGSSSKAFTSASIAMLVDEKKVDLDAPVTRYIPSFQMYDPYVSRELTVRDLLSHRSGLARGELAWYGSGFDRDELVRRIRFLQPSWSFRSQFGYQNLMYITAGQVVAKASGMSWDDFVSTRIFAPLGMGNSSTTIRALDKRTDLASPHANADSGGGVVAVKWRNLDNAGPAGSINSNAVDMAQWVRMLLGDGKYGGKQVISRRLVEEMRQSQMFIRLDSAARANNPDTHYSSYGLGWFLEDYRGKALVHHGGNVDGFTALVAMLPEDKFGVVLLTNMNGSGLPQPLLHKILDMHLGGSGRDWVADAVTRQEQARARAAAAAARNPQAQTRPSGGKPTLALSEYVGTYVDSLYGEMVVREQNGGLHLTFGPTWRSQMVYWNADNFRVKFDTPVLPAFFVNFRVNPQGKVNELIADLVGVPVSFVRRPTPPRPPPIDYSAPANAPYIAINVTVPTREGHTLAGTLTIPKVASASARVPAVVTITGSGGQTRDEPFSATTNFRPFRQIADSLARRGIATLRMDDRGIGESTGDHAKATSSDFAEDIRAGLAYLRTRPEIDAGKLGLVGHSEGGLIAPIVATREPDLKGIVLLAGPGKRGRDILTFQLRNLAEKDTSLTPAKRAEQIGRIPTYIDSLAATNPWMKYFFDHDPLATAKQVKTPVLVLNGATDQQVTPDQVAALVKAFKAGGNRDVTSRVFPRLNHLFVYDPVGYPGGYQNLTNFDVAPEVLGTVADWLAQRLR
ncbi:alpha/beta fold hydrolase [Gemmatimonas aurantiaca]|uniref:alpha/beta fold hydrolase n=1 Tax=Gemmatimonas aurantiaca TaxID=173480 RepID=UPI00301BFBDC